MSFGQYILFEDRIAMRIRRTLSDDDYVAQVRKRDLAFRRSRWAYPVALLVATGAVCAVAIGFRGLVQLSEGSRLALVGFLAGVLYAGMLLFFLLGTIACLIEWGRARRGDRTERLLLKYYDELKAGKSSNNKGCIAAERSGASNYAIG